MSDSCHSKSNPDPTEKRSLLGTCQLCPNSLLSTLWEDSTLRAYSSAWESQSQLFTPLEPKLASDGESHKIMKQLTPIKVTYNYLHVDNSDLVLAELPGQVKLIKITW